MIISGGPAARWAITTSNIDFALYTWQIIWRFSLHCLMRFLCTWVKGISGVWVGCMDQGLRNNFEIVLFGSVKPFFFFKFQAHVLCLVLAGSLSFSELPCSISLLLSLSVCLCFSPPNFLPVSVLYRRTLSVVQMTKYCNLF